MTSARSAATRRFVWGLVAVTVVALVVRIVYILTARQDFFADFEIGGDPFRLGDAYLYQRGAVLLAEGEGFINPYQFDLFGIRQEDASHVPLFMLWLWLPAAVGITGAEAAALWSAVLGAGTVVLVGCTGRLIAGTRVGLGAAALAAVYPNVFSHDGFLQSETMAIFAVTLTVFLAYRYWQAPSRWRAAWVGVGCALAMLSRSELALLVPILLAPLLWRTPDTSGCERLGRLVLAGVAAAVLVSPWVAFNLTRFERPVTLSDNFGYTLLTATCDTTYYGEGIGYWDFACAEPTYERIDAPRNDRSVNEVAFRKEAIEYIRAHPSRVPVVVVARWARATGVWDLFTGFDQVDKDRYVEGRDALVAWGGAFMFYGLASFSVVGVIALRHRRVTVIPLVAPLVVVMLAITLTFYMNRYRASAETCLCLLAAVGIDAALERVGRRRPRVSRSPEPVTAATAD